MSHEHHAKVLLEFIREIDGCIEDSATTGCVPVLDAVETVRLLKALVRGAPVHETDDEKIKRRIRRPDLTVTALTFQWGGAQ